MPFFSVVIPLYNKAKYISHTLDSALNQSFLDFEIIIVDDGSTDESVTIVSHFIDERIRLVTQENQGASRARIKGIETANGKYVALLDADDIWKNNHLEELYNTINLFPEAILYCTNYEIKRGLDFITPAVFNFKYGTNPIIIEDFFKGHIINYIASSSSAAFKKTDYYKIPGYNTKLRSGQDTDLWVQFALKGAVAFNPKITMTYNFYDDTSLSNSHYNEDRMAFINSYQDVEKQNASLKFYLDINRYALILRLKLLGGHDEDIKNLKKSLDKKHLNFKQKVTLLLPRKILICLKSMQRFLLRKKIYLTAYK